jgi:hypothetical protein
MVHCVCDLVLRAVDVKQRICLSKEAPVEFLLLLLWCSMASPGLVILQFRGPWFCFSSAVSSGEGWRNESR